MALVQSSLNLSYQSTSCSIDHRLRCWDIGVEINILCYWQSGLKSRTNALNSKLPSSTSIKLSLLLTTPHFSKQLFIVVPVTSFHASCAHWMAISIFTSLTISVAEDFSLIYASTYLTSLFLCLILKFRIIPESTGWILEVLFLGRKMIFICKKKSTIDSGWYVALSRKKIIFLCSNNNFLLNCFSTAIITSDVIHNFRLEK